MALAIDVTTNKHDTNVTSTTTSTFSTSGNNELLLAFFMADSFIDMNTVTGAGLTWVLVANPSSGAGMAYIWRAFAPTPLTNATVTGNFTGGTPTSIFVSVTAFTGADPAGVNGSGAIGNTVVNTQGSGTPSASLVTTRNNSWVWGCVSDQTNNDTPTYGSNQRQVGLDVDDTNLVSHWVQSQTIPTPSLGTTVTINDTAPTGIAFGMAIVEILPLFTPIFSVGNKAQQPVIVNTIISV